MDDTGVSVVSSPGVSAVETERDLVDTARVTHHQVEPRLNVSK